MIQVISDIHLETRQKIVYPTVSANILAICGDLGHPRQPIYHSFLSWAAQHYQSVYMVAGNHEYYHHHDDVQMTNDYITKLVSQWPNVHFLNNQSHLLSINNYEYQIFGSTLWSYSNGYDLSEMINDYHHIKKKVWCGHNNSSMYTKKHISYTDTDELHHVALNSLHVSITEAIKTQRKMIVLTHHLPSFSQLHDPTNIINYAYANNLDDLLQPPIVLWLHGHIHKTIDWVSGSTRVVCNPMGYQNQPVISFNDSKCIDMTHLPFSIC